MMKKLTVILLIAVIAAGLLAGCGGAEEKEPIITVTFNGETFKIDRYKIQSPSITIYSSDFEEDYFLIDIPFYVSFIDDEGVEELPYSYYVQEGIKEIIFLFEVDIFITPKTLIFYEPLNPSNRYKLDLK